MRHFRYRLRHRLHAKLRRHRHAREARYFAPVIFAILREALTVLSEARRALERLGSQPKQTPGHGIVPTETRF